MASDPKLQSALEDLMAADVLAKEEFAAMLDEPVPFELASAIQNAQTKTTANASSPPKVLSRLTTATAIIALAIGGLFGYLGGAAQNAQLASTPDWLASVAEYHTVYAGQKRHLVEVGADEAEHIQAWLSKSVGSDVRIPDLSDQGLTFQGARLLVASGKPVAQLMYTDANERVVALCQIKSSKPLGEFVERNINSFDMVTWGAANANFVVIGDEGQHDLNRIAQAAAAQV
ncbi:anti-sigma factor [Aliiroseovarius sp. S1339]|nr:anti-sigma factor [Aliiroseovarius sp. S1339]